MIRIVNNIIDTKYDIYIKNIKNIQFNGYIFKIYSNINFVNRSLVTSYN